ncbi:MAG: helix-turn-helix transcriptional regulator [Clostridium cochlearium]|uniref:MerR family transcriptional regulator n=1 Tax=Clostridium cochlearium TaxID=1494 RepID=A0A2X2W3Q0_CLOCO|nr:helix-turn-helix transcriptional regulator [Clostridium cochlearium]MDU1442082.1 helix-turn-helix transcriptional regulator [Clostridium cochlearium]SQB35478.1 MerR family transcriptional regulator [Clostridium cochlearium]
MDIGSKIKELRESKGLTQKELGKRIGVTAVTITRYERGDRNPSIEMLNKIADALNVPLSDLILHRTQDSLEILYEVPPSKNQLIDRKIDCICELIAAISYEETTIRNFSFSIDELFKIQEYISNQLLIKISEIKNVNYTVKIKDNTL